MLRIGVCASVYLFIHIPNIPLSLSLYLSFSLSLSLSFSFFQFNKKLPDDALRRMEGKDFGWDRKFDLEPRALVELVRLPKLGRTLYKGIH
jgi:hypothetical protein